MEISWEYLLWAAVLCIALLVLSLLVAAAVVLSLPSTYFVQRAVPHAAVNWHPAVRVLIRLAKNLLGLALVAMGIVLSIPGIPGQGVLIVLIGLLLLDFPAKRRLMRKLLNQPRVRTAINRLRTRFGRPPLQFPEGPQRSPANRSVT